MERCTVYGDLTTREGVALTTALHAKGLVFDFVEESATLAFSLAARSGRDKGPYLRTPEGFVLAEVHAILDWIEALHPVPALLPSTPIRATCARLLEDWLEFWLPFWPRRSWATLEGVGVHLDSAGFLLGREPTRPDWLLAAWLESDVLIHASARAHLARHAPRLVTLGSDLLERQVSAADADDVIPISLLAVLEDLARDYHGYLEGNHQALKDGGDRVFLDLGLGRRALPVREGPEARRMEIGRLLADRPRSVRRDVSRVLEPVGAWHALTLPPVLERLDPSDPRSL